MHRTRQQQAHAPSARLNGRAAAKVRVATKMTPLGFACLAPALSLAESTADICLPQPSLQLSRRRSCLQRPPPPLQRSRRLPCLQMPPPPKPLSLHSLQTDRGLRRPVEFVVPCAQIERPPQPFKQSVGRDLSARRRVAVVSTSISMAGGELSARRRAAVGTRSVSMAGRDLPARTESGGLRWWRPLYAWPAARSLQGLQEGGLRWWRPL